MHIYNGFVPVGCNWYKFEFDSYLFLIDVFWLLVSFILLWAVTQTATNHLMN